MTEFSALDWQSRFVWGVVGGEVEWVTSLPAMPWDRFQDTEGGSAIAASGVPASFVIREDHVLIVRLRLWEEEWADLLELIAWGQGSNSFLWYPDDAVDDSYEVYLHAPRAGQRFQPTRGDFPGLLEVSIELRRVDGGTWPLSFFQTEEAES